ncbi:MAG: 5-formyltetrahydrofolate cyclo-ligase [Nocardioidaceae bacterium]
MTSKESLRAQIRRGRSRLSAEDLAAADEALARRTIDLPEVAAAEVVAVYLSVGDEPPTRRLADALLERGATVLSPVMAPNRVLDWAAYTGADELRVAAYGIAEPSGARLGGTALRSAGVVVLPALAVDRTGRRLGRGAGYYDRALAHADPRATRIALVFDDELADFVPTEPHDEPVHLVVTPSRTWRCTDG